MAKTKTKTKTGITARRDEKIPLTARALFQRVNRKLMGHGEVLRVTRSAHLLDKLGYYHIVRGGVVVRKDVDLKKLGEELAVIKPFEVFTAGA